MADNWEAVSGYDTNDYTDAMIIEMDAGSKRFREISGQALVAGEKNSQYIRFMIPRYWDGIDVSEMNISIVYGLAGKYYGESDAVSVERTDDRLRFGWVVPEEACCIAGTLLFEIIIKNDAYTLKSQIVETIVFKSINIDNIAPEPTREAWYKEFQARVDQALTSAEDILSEAQDVVAEARAYVGAPLVARTADDFEDTDRIYVYTGSEEGYNTGHWYYWRGTAMAWTDGGVYNAAAVDTDTTLSIAGKAADAKEVGDQITDLKEDLNDFETDINSLVGRNAGVLDSDGIGDLDVADNSGNVLVRFANGEIKTKNFDSTILRILNEETDDSDLDISDAFGNVLARLKDGNFITKNFSGFQYITFNSDTENYSGQQLTLSVGKTFNRGDRIVIHMERGAMPWNTGAIVSYYENQTPIKENWRGDCAWLEHTVSQDNAVISAVYPENSTNMTNGAVRLEVSLLGDIPIKPNIVTVKQDGSGDFTTLRGALDSIGTKANDVLNPYRIEIYPGTYNVMSDYTDAEISDAAFDITRFIGPRVLNGTYLVGMGNPDDIVINGILDATIWQSSIRGVVSTLNFQGTGGAENLTIVATNLRYCVHDDYTCPYGKPHKRNVKNCIFRAYGAMSYTPAVTYGAGTRPSGNIFEFENCDFGLIVGVHTANPFVGAGSITYKNCRGTQCEIGDLLDSSDEIYTPYKIINCDFDQIYVHNWQLDPYSFPHVRIDAIGGTDVFYSIPSFVPYISKDVETTVPLNLAAGSVVERYYAGTRGIGWRAATSPDTACGVVIRNDNDTYVQKSGFVPTNHVGISSCSLGDYIGIVNGKLAVVANADNALGKVVLIDTSGVGHIKIDWRS